jgi:3-methyladenine DNA glycosylase/8-oxoguanine DNA glycosylase
VSVEADEGTRRTIALAAPLDVVRTTEPLRHGPHDPSCRVVDGVVWRAWRSPAGPATIRLVTHPDRVEATAWGEGADAALDAAPNLIGSTDDDSGFRPAHGPVADLWNRFPGLRITRTGSVTEALIAHVLEQRVTPFEAHRAHQQVAERWGDPAPGPMGLLLPPDPQRLAGASHYELHLAGVEQDRGDLVRRLAASARRLDALALLPPAAAHQRLREVAGVGAWAAARVAMTALGDADAVPVGDPRLAADVTFALTGTATDDDEALLAALEPWAGHRARVVRLVAVGGLHAPAHGPRYAPTT